MQIRRQQRRTAARGLNDPPWMERESRPRNSPENLLFGTEKPVPSVDSLRPRLRQKFVREFNLGRRVGDAGASVPGCSDCVADSPIAAPSMLSSRHSPQADRAIVRGRAGLRRLCFSQETRVLNCVLFQSPFQSGCFLRHF